MTAYARLRAPFLALLAAVLSTACSGTSATEPERLLADDGIAGRYVLEQVNGAELPYAFYVVEQTDEYEGARILDGVLVLNTDGTYARSVTVQWMLGVNGPRQENTFSDRGTFTVGGEGLVLDPYEGDPIAAVVRAGEVTVVFSHSQDSTPEMTYTFRR